MSNSDLYDNMQNRGERRAFNALENAEFRPLKISRDLENLFESKARELGVPDPFFRASMVIDQLQNVLERVSLEGDLFPDLENPLRTPIIPNAVAQANQIINNNPANAAMAAAPVNTGFIGQGNVNIDPVTRLTPNEEVLLNPFDRDWETYILYCN